MATKSDPDTTDTTDTTTDDGTTNGDGTPDATTDADAKALQAALNKERQASKRAEAERKKLEQRLADLEAQNMSDQEKAVAEAKAAGRAEAMAEMRGHLLRDRVTARAAGKLAKPDYAARLLDLSGFEADENGQFDDKAIDAAIDELIAGDATLAVPAAATATQRPPLGPRGQMPSTSTAATQTGAGGLTEGDVWLRSH